MVSQHKYAFGYFSSLLVKPTGTVYQITQDRPGFREIAIFLFSVGAARGIIELFWELLMAGQLGRTLSNPELFRRQFLADGSILVLGNVTTAYVRWGMFALIPFVLCRFLGSRVRFEVFLRLYGIVLGLFVVTLLPNFLYLFFKLPMLRFEVSEVYNPVFGIGQVLTSLALIFITYKIARIAAGLPRWESLLVSPAIPLVNIGLLVLCSHIFFNLPAVMGLSHRKGLYIAAACFVVATSAAVPILLWLGFRIDKMKRA